MRSQTLYIGKFDLYGTTLPFLKKFYVPKPGDPPQFEAVYKEILVYQAKSDFSGRCNLGSNGKPSIFQSPAYCEPMGDEPYDIVINDVERGVSVKFSKAESAHESTVGSSIGLEAVTEIDSDCTVDSGYGAFKMRRMWTGDGGAELFECWITLDVCYSSLLSRKGHGSGENFRSAFWAVRARKYADGEEIGLDGEV